VYLNKLEIIGFKSFVDKVGVDFDSGITAIGPNGCENKHCGCSKWLIMNKQCAEKFNDGERNIQRYQNRKPLGYARYL
jgi:chromosome segregation protein